MLAYYLYSVSKRFYGYSLLGHIVSTTCSLKTYNKTE